MLKKIIALCALQLITLLTFASEQTIAQKKSASQQIEKLKEHIPVPELQKIVLNYIGNEYIPTKLDENKRIVKAALSQNGEYLVSLSTDSKAYYHSEETAKIWKFENGKYKLTHAFDIPMMVQNVALSNDGAYIAFQINSDEVHIWQLKNNTYAENQIEKGLIFDSEASLQFFGNSKMLGRATNDSVQVWKLSDTLKKFVLQRNFNTYHHVASVAFSSDGKYIAGGTRSGNINLWEPDNSKPFMSLETRASDPVDPRVKVTISPDSNQLAAYRSSVELFKMKNNRLEPFQIIEPDNNVDMVKFSPDNNHLAIIIPDPSRSWKPKINVWKMNPKSLKYENKSAIIGDRMDLIGFAPNNSIITLNVNTPHNKELIVWENQKELLEQDADEKIKSAAEQEQPVVTEVD